MVDAVVFLGPSLNVEIAKQYLPAVYCGPAAQGDVLRVLPRRPRLIGIIDGYFETVPAVWHKEILHAMSVGVHVLGAASMGALRAAELEPFGMVGVGQVFEWYRSGAIEDDDEVAVAHGPADSGYRAASEAMVNIRSAVASAQAANLIADAVASRLLEVAKGLHYSERDYRRLFQLLRDEMDAATVDPLMDYFLSLRPRLKERDAILLLERAAALLASDTPPMQPAFSLERTVFLDAMIHEVERLAAEEQWASLPARHEGRADDMWVRHEVLMRLLARREATRLGFDCTLTEQAEARTAFAAAHGIVSEEQLRDRLRSCGIDDRAFAAMMRDAVLLEKLDRHYDRDLRAAAPEHIRIRTFQRGASEPL
jgi:hypothetical protein